MEKSPFANDGRRVRRRIRREMPDDAQCFLCGLTQPEILRRVHRSVIEQYPRELVPEFAERHPDQVRRRLLEDDHVLNHANDPDLTVWLCLNCHRVVTEARRDTGAETTHDADRHVLEQIEAALRALAAFLMLLAQTLFRCAEEIAAFLRRLTEVVPGWREELAVG